MGYGIWYLVLVLGELKGINGHGMVGWTTELTSAKLSCHDGNYTRWRFAGLGLVY